jgi:hypothetical protein
MTDALFKFDEIGDWSEIKLDIVEKYGAAYAKILGAKRFKKFYIDGFSGAGRHISRQTGKQIEGSPARALRISPPFDRYYFIDMNPQKTRYLQKLCDGRSDVSIHTGDCNAYLTTQLLPTIQYGDYKRGLCHAASGLRSRWRFGSHGNEENQLSRLPLSARDHPAGDLALSPVHTELP